MKRILIHSGKHPFQPFDYGASYARSMAVLGGNSGNLLFADAVYKYLYTSAERELASDGYRFHTDDPAMAAEAINEKYDCVVIPAANWLSTYYHQLLPRHAAKIRRLKIPCVVVGLGAQAGTRDNFDALESIAPEAKEFLAAVSEKSHSISVRGEFTAACLQKLGFGNVNVTGCPSFYRNQERFEVKKRAMSRKDFRVAVNGNAKYVRSYAHIFRRYESTYFCQGDILKVLKQTWRLPPKELKRLAVDGFTMRLLAEGRARCYGDIRPWLAELQRFDFSIGTRIHGNIIALLAGVPALVVGHDSRTREMAEFFKIPTASLGELKNQRDVFELYEAADYGPMHAAYPEKLRNMAQFFEDNGLATTLRHATNLYEDELKQREFAVPPKPASSAPLFHAVARLGDLYSLARSPRRARVSPA